MVGKCDFHDESIGHIRSEILEVKELVKNEVEESKKFRQEMRETIQGDNGLAMKVDRNTRFRKDEENSKSVWKKVFPSIVGGVTVGVIIFLMQVIL